ncbi:GNAT family N-acetyltransferase [Actinomyces sp. F1_1611]
MSRTANGGRYMPVKRALDVMVVAIVAVPALAVGLLVALVVRVSLGSPVLFKQVRIGLNEKPFVLLKFRSMAPEFNRYGERVPTEQRITRFGRLLRKSSLDELPQLINILRGDMSLVGPRPLLPEYLPFYREQERLRHSVRPGLTGEAQVSGRNTLSWDERLAMDVEYCEHPSLLRDCRIVGETVRQVFLSSGTQSSPWDWGEPLNVERGYPKREQYALRRFEPRDIPLRVSWFNDSRVRKYMSLEGEFTEAGTGEWLVAARKDKCRKDLVVVDRETSQVVAMVGYRGLEEGQLAEVYEAVDPRLQGQGIGTAALRLLLEYMKSRQEHAGAFASIDRNNQASIRLHERCGFAQAQPQTSSSRIRLEYRW